MNGNKFHRISFASISIQSPFQINCCFCCSLKLKVQLSFNCFVMSQFALNFISKLKGKLVSRNNVINAFMMRYPKQTSVAFTAIKTIIADLFTQTVIEGTSINNIDWTRNAVFGTFGFLYMGCFQYWLFNILFFKWFPGVTIKQTAKKVFADQFIKGPFCYWPSFYFVRTLINEKLDINEKTLISVKTTYKANIVHDLKAYWSIWIPAQCITFGIMPIHLRLPFIATLSFFWCCILSSMHGSYDHEQEVEIAVAKELKLLQIDQILEELVVWICSDNIYC